MKIVKPRFAFHSILILVCATLMLQCKGNKKELNLDDINRLANRQYTELKLKKRFKVISGGTLQHVALLKQGSTSSVLVFDIKDGNFVILKEFIVPDGFDSLQLRFINPNLDYSHLALLLKDLKTGDYQLRLFDCRDFNQTFNIAKDRLNELVIKKNPKNENEEVIEYNKLLYRFDSFQYIETIYDMPLFFLHPIGFGEEETTIQLSNRGNYSGRAYITFSFPDAIKNEGNIALTKKIDTVKFISPGRQVFIGRGQYRAAEYPAVEITKQPFPGGNRMRLPLKLRKEIGRIQVRISYDFRGNMENWPSERDKNTMPNKIVKDQQGYWSYIVQ